MKSNNKSTSSISTGSAKMPHLRNWVVSILYQFLNLKWVWHRLVEECVRLWSQKSNNISTSSISTGFVKMPNFFSRPSLERMSRRKMRNSLSVSSSCSISFLCSLSVSLRGSGGGALARGSNTRRAANRNGSDIMIHGRLARALDCKPCGQGSNSGCKKVKDHFTVLSQHLRSRSACLTFMCTAHSEIVAHLEDPMLTFWQENA